MTAPENGAIATLHRVRAGFATGIAWVAGLGLLAIFVVNVGQIALRATGGGLIWVSDFSRLTFVWVALLGGAAAYGLNDHITVTFVVDRVPPRARVAAALVVRLAEILLAVIILIAGLAILETRMGIDYVQLGVPTGLAYLAVPVFAALVLLFAVTGRLTGEGSGTEPEVELAAEQIRQDEATRRAGEDR